MQPILQNELWPSPVQQYQRVANTIGLHSRTGRPGRDACQAGLSAAEVLLDWILAENGADALGDPGTTVAHETGAETPRLRDPIVSWSTTVAPKEDLD